MNERHIAVISDLHIGGRDPTSGRGFQMMSRPEVLARFVDELGADELVINGDFVDFLAEEGGTPGVWDPIIEDPRRAAETFLRIANQSRFSVVFDALGRYLRRGRITILLGNHDIELSYASVRDALFERVDGRERDLRFLYDGEAYAFDNAIIEHGNRYDRFNAVDHDGLRRYRSLASRRQEASFSEIFTPPAGSCLVAEVMNPVKTLFPFVDLLKPEDATVVPLLLALMPGLKWKAGKALRALKHGVGGGTSKKRPDVPVRMSEVSTRGRANDPAHDALVEALGEDEARAFARRVGLEASQPLTDVSLRDKLPLARSIINLLGADEAEPLEERLPAVLRAFRTIQSDRSFDLDYDEPSNGYRKAANALAARGFDFVVFGHTHHAKDYALDGGARYLNSGTWADLLRVPDAIVSGEDAEALAALRTFAEDLTFDRFGPYIAFSPSYVELDVLGDRVTAARTQVYTTDT
ncbi:MAG: metallophosphoesterase [Deltaproteobacteria bacterium]